LKSIKTLFLTAALALVAAGCSTADGERGSASTRKTTPQNAAQTTPTPQAAGAHDGHSHPPIEEGRVPAFEKEPRNLPATLSPEMFTGMTRRAYQAVREIPETIAQLPCYCHCDRGFGHKSLHSCFVDTHAAGCAVCVEEAVAAYRLQKEERLTPAQIRERIIAEYSKNQ
jgi:hypothetical protein